MKMPVWPPGRSSPQSSHFAQRWITMFEPRGFAVTQWPCTFTSKPSSRLYHSAALVASCTSTAIDPTSVNMPKHCSNAHIQVVTAALRTTAGHPFPQQNLPQGRMVVQSEFVLSHDRNGSVRTPTRSGSNPDRGVALPSRALLDSSHLGCPPDDPFGSSVEGELELPCVRPESANGFLHVGHSLGCVLPTPVASGPRVIQFHVGFFRVGRAFL